MSGAAQLPVFLSKAINEYLLVRQARGLAANSLIAYRGDNVDLPLRTPPVPVEHGVSAAYQVLRRALFPGSAEVVFCCHALSIAVRLVA